MKKRFLTSFILILAMIASCISSSFITAYATDIVLTEKTVSASDAPDNSSLIIATYGSDNAMLGCKIYNGNETANYAEDLKESLDNAVRVKAFLWNMGNIESLATSKSLFVAHTPTPTTIPTSIPTPTLTATLMPTATPTITQTPMPTATPSPTAIPTPTEKPNSVLTVYFSYTNNTENLAKKVQRVTNSDIYKITAAEPYTDEILNYYGNNRAYIEQNNKSTRPEISGVPENIADYDIIMLGYPIWYGYEPRVICTFLESCDLSGKIIMPFCTSGSSSISSSVSEIKTICPNSTVTTGFRGTTSTTDTEIQNWLNVNNFSRK